MEKTFDIKEELKKLPDAPGVYIMHDKDDVIIYIGKDNPMSMHTDRTNAVIYFWTKINLRPHITRVIFYAR